MIMYIIIYNYIFRRQVRAILHQSAAASDKTWSLYAGDFNFVVNRTDRTPNPAGPELGEKDEHHWVTGLSGTFE